MPADFADLGPRDAVDQVLHRLVRAGTIRRITRGLYDKPSLNALTGKSTHPDPRAQANSQQASGVKVKDRYGLR